MANITKEKVIQKLQSFLTEAVEIRKKDRVYFSDSGCYNRLRFQGWVSGILTVLDSCGIKATEVGLLRNALHVENVYDTNIAFVENQLRGILSGITEGFIDVEARMELDSEKLLETIFDKFHKVVRQLRTRHNGRGTLEVNDEYDVQDLLHALLILHFDDVRPEEWTPSYAGGSLRMDFLLKDPGIVIEVKKTRVSMTAKDLGEQLLIDREKYKAHPDCRKLYCFVYDPQGYLGNPIGIKKDLEQNQDNYFKVFIRPE